MAPTAAAHGMLWASASRRPGSSDGAAAGYNFVALRTVDDFVTESEALDNCLDQYADHLRAGATAVFSIRKNARSVACVEIGLHEAEVTMPTVVQLRAARNRRAPPEVWQATYAWIGSQRLEPLAPERHTPRPCETHGTPGASCGTPIWHSWPARRTSRRSGVS